MSTGTEPGLLSSLIRYWQMSLLIVAGVTILSGIVTWGANAQVQAKATIGLAAPRESSVIFNGAQGDASLARYTRQRARFITSDAVIGAVAADLGRDDLTDLRTDIVASASTDSNVITILTTADDSESAVALAQSVVDAYRSQTTRQIDELTDAAIDSLLASAGQISEEVDIVEASPAVAATAADAIGELQIQAADLETSRALTGDGVEFVIVPRIDSVVEPGPPFRELALGALVGLTIAASVAWVRADRNRPLADVDDAAAILDAPCLGDVMRQPAVMPLDVEVVTQLPTHDHRLLWSALSHGVPFGAIVVTSVDTDAPAWTAVNLAAAAAREGVDVLLVDADMQTTQMLGREPAATGLAQLLSTGSDWSDHVVTIDEFGRDHFSMLPSGPEVEVNQVHGLLAGGYVEQWRQRYDYVVIATRSLGDDTVARALAETAGQLLVVVGHQAEERKLVQLRRQATLCDIAIVGFALRGPKRANLVAPHPSLALTSSVSAAVAEPSPEPPDEPVSVPAAAREPGPTPSATATLTPTSTPPLISATARDLQPSQERVSPPVPPPPPVPASTPTPPPPPLLLCSCSSSGAHSTAREVARAYRPDRDPRRTGQLRRFRNLRRGGRDTPRGRRPRGHGLLPRGWHASAPPGPPRRYRGMDLVHLPAVRRRSLETLTHSALSIGHVVARRRVDVALVFNAANSPLVPALRLARIPVATHVDGLEWQRSKWGPTGQRYYRLAESAAVRWSDALIADASGISDYLRSEFGARSELLTYGAPLIHGSRPELLAALDLAPKRFHLVVARFEPENHVDVIVDGYVRSQADLPLVVVGSAPYAEQYSARVQSLADNRVRMLGGVWDQVLLDELYANALTYLHGHSVGGTNPSLLRAIGAGTATDAFDCTFNREVLGPEGRYWSSADSVSSLVTSAESDCRATVARGERSRARAAAYDWDQVATGYEQLCVRLADKELTRPGLSGRRKCSRWEPDRNGSS